VFVLEVVFSQPDGIDVVTWEMLRSNLNGFAERGNSFLKSMSPDGGKRKHGVHYSYEGHGLEGVGRLMDVAPVSHMYTRKGNALSTLLRVRLDSLFSKPAKKRDVPFGHDILQRIDLCA